MTIGNEGWRSCEVFFNPTLLAQNAVVQPVNPPPAPVVVASIQATIIDSLMSCDELLRPIMANNIRIAGTLQHTPFSSRECFILVNRRM